MQHFQITSTMQYFQITFQEINDTELLKMIDQAENVAECLKQLAAAGWKMEDVANVKRLTKEEFCEIAFKDIPTAHIINDNSDLANTERTRRAKVEIEARQGKVNNVEADAKFNGSKEEIIHDGFHLFCNFKSDQNITNDVRIDNFNNENSMFGKMLWSKNQNGIGAMFILNHESDKEKFLKRIESWFGAPSVKEFVPRMIKK